MEDELYNNDTVSSVGGNMPKSTYDNIGIDKQQKLIEVGTQLFSKNLFEDVDVQMVVKAAQIPRGSFYAYFSDIMHG